MQRSVRLRQRGDANMICHHRWHVVGIHAPLHRSAPCPALHMFWLCCCKQDWSQVSHCDSSRLYNLYPPIILFQSIQKGDEQVI